MPLPCRPASNTSRRLFASQRAQTDDGRRGGEEIDDDNDSMFVLDGVAIRGPPQRSQPSLVRRYPARSRFEIAERPSLVIFFKTLLAYVKKTSSRKKKTSRERTKSLESRERKKMNGIHFFSLPNRLFESRKKNLYFAAFSVKKDPRGVSLSVILRSRLLLSAIRQRRSTEKK